MIYSHRARGSRSSLAAAARLRRAGQSMIEILVALAVGVILIVGAITLIVPALQNNANVTQAQAAAGLGKELLENVRVFAEGNWSGVATLATTSANKFYLAAASPFTTSTGIESVTISTTTYQRYFYLDDVYRNGSGKIAGSGVSDPTMKQITVVYIWPESSSTLVSYLRRTGSDAFSQTDWSSGPNQNGPLTATGTNAKFATSSNINYASSGAIMISGMSGP